MQKSIISILYNKFLESIDRSTWSDIFLVTAKIFTWSIISLFLINTPESMEKLAMAIKWHDFAIVKIVGAFTVVFFYKSIVEYGKTFLFWIIDSFAEMAKNETHGPLYQNIPVIELVEYIFTASSYSRSEFCEYFGVSRKVFDTLSSGFDSVGVFVRGENNARTLSSEYSRSDIASILTRASETGEIRPLIREVKGGYTHSPTFRTVSLSDFRTSAS